LTTSAAISLKIVDVVRFDEHSVRPNADGVLVARLCGQDSQADDRKVAQAEGRSERMQKLSAVEPWRIQIEHDHVPQPALEIVGP
jgi:hypothetical protein